MTEASKRANDDCIYCGKPSGSAEHTVAASVGGLRKHRGILCAECNQTFSAIDGCLADDLRLLNAQVGVQNTRTKEPVAVDVEVPGTGQSFVLSEGGELRHKDAVVVRDTTVNGVRTIEAVVSTQKQADDFIHRLRAEGKPMKVAPRFTVPHLRVEPPQQLSGFGGPQSFRAVAKTVLNLLAYWQPAVAREPWLTPIKSFVAGGTDNTFADFQYDEEPDPRLPPDSFEFQHRFIIVFDATTGLSYAKVSLLGVYEICVRLGTGSWDRTVTYIYDMDVLAARAPNDIAEKVIEGVALSPPGSKTDDPRRPYIRKVALLRAKCGEKQWREEVEGLLAALNATCTSPVEERGDLVLSVVHGQRQRLLELAVSVLSSLSRQFVDQFGEDGVAFARRLRGLLQGDATHRTGITEFTFCIVETLCMVMADHLLEILNERAVDAEELRGLLEGNAGLSIVGSYLVTEVLQPQFEAMTNADAPIE